MCRCFNCLPGLPSPLLAPPPLLLAGSRSCYQRCSSEPFFPISSRCRHLASPLETISDLYAFLEDSSLCSNFVSDSSGVWMRDQTKKPPQILHQPPQIRREIRPKTHGDGKSNSQRPRAASPSHRNPTSTTASNPPPTTTHNQRREQHATLLPSSAITAIAPICCLSP